MPYGKLRVDELENSLGALVDLTNLPSRVEVSDTAPSNPVDADLWWDSVGGSLYVYYGTDWVPATATGEAAVGGVFSRSGTTIQPQTAGDDLDLGTGDLSADAGTFSGQVNAGDIATGNGSRLYSSGGVYVRTDGNDTEGSVFKSFVSEYTDAGTKIDIKADGRVLIGGSLPSSPNIKLSDDGKGTFSTGVLFGSDTADANTLDDYEEGTWTPKLYERVGGTGTPAEVSDAVYQTSFNGAWYQKIGNTVRFGGCLRITDKGSITSSDHVWVGGFPFSAKALATPYGEQRAAGTIAATTGLTLSSGETLMFTCPVSGADHGSLYALNLAGGTNSAVNGGDITDSFYVTSFAGCYIVE